MDITRIVVLLAVLAAAPTLAQDMPSLPGNELEAVSQQAIRPLAQHCEGCHGPGGHSTQQNVPAIAGKPAPEILAALEQFYYYERHCPTVKVVDGDGEAVERNMCDLTNALNKQEALALASYFEAAGNLSGQ
jgi:cytochrome c553